MTRAALFWCRVLRPDGADGKEHRELISGAVFFRSPRTGLAFAWACPFFDCVDQEPGLCHGLDIGLKRPDIGRCGDRLGPIGDGTGIHDDRDRAPGHVRVNPAVLALVLGISAFPPPRGSFGAAERGVQDDTDESSAGDERVVDRAKDCVDVVDIHEREQGAGRIERSEVERGESPRVGHEESGFGVFGIREFVGEINEAFALVDTGDGCAVAGELTIERAFAAGNIEYAGTFERFEQLQHARPDEVGLQVVA